MKKPHELNLILDMDDHRAASFHEMLRELIADAAGGRMWIRMASMRSLDPQNLGMQVNMLPDLLDVESPFQGPVGMEGFWFVEAILTGADGWEDHVDTLMDALAPYAGVLGENPGGGLSVRVAVETPGAIQAVQMACPLIMDVLLNVGLSPVIRSTEVLTEAEMDARLAAP